MMERLKGKTLLIVEDEVDLREPLVMEFESLGCRVFEANNGREAMSVLQREKVDAVISDIRMPGGDGIELLKNIKGLNYVFPVVMLITGFSDLTKEEAYHLGAEAILSKPFDLDEIDAAVLKILTPLEERWQSVVDPEQAKHRVEKSFSNFAKAVEEGSLGLGRGGLFLGIPNPPPSTGHPISFHIRFEDGPLLHLDGFGVVRWVRSEESDEVAKGCGIEFESLSERARQDVLKLTHLLKTVPYIPKGPF
jgi:CheY-like chemotaxis protein